MGFVFNVALLTKNPDLMAGLLFSMVVVGHHGGNSMLIRKV
jgi:hypothetical protein